ncbi:ribose transport system permease protein [Ruaniaceae bacterium KH17]|nr:ribose transport system permease protein [Ruaniaceae bacterium KH17]
MMKLREIDWKDLLVRNNTFLIFVILIIFSAIVSDSFLQPMNIRNILLQQAGPILVAIGMLFVILAGGIDLSVGSLMAVGATTAAVLMSSGFGIGTSILLALILGGTFGLLSGVLVAYGRIQGFVATLAVMTIAKGASYLITNGRPISIEQNISALSSRAYGYPIIWITCIVILVALFVHRYTGYGRKVIGIGSNETALRLAGVPTRRYVLSTYVFSGIFAAAAGVFVASRTSTGSASIGSGQELDAIAAVVIGGASLVGGRGFVLNTVVGALILGMIGNMMNLMGVPSYPQDIIKGIIIIVAVLLQVATGRTHRSV